MTTTRPDLTALVGSRICHDLISPLGAISNGVELLNMTGAAQGPEMALIAESIENANARIRFFRIAFGAAATDQELGRAEITSIINDMARSGRANVVWTPEEEALPRVEVKLAFLLIQCLESAMPFGGQIIIDCDDGHWTLVGSAEKLKIQPEIWEVLADGPNVHDVSAADVHFGLIPVLLNQLQRTLQVDVAEDRIEINF